MVSWSQPSRSILVSVGPRFESRRCRILSGPEKNRPGSYCGRDQPTIEPLTEKCKGTCEHQHRFLEPKAQHPRPLLFCYIN